MRDMAWEYIYKNWRSNWVNRIKREGGSDEEANDALQDKCMSFQQVVTMPNFQVKATLKGYLTICVYRQWLKNKGRQPKTEELQDHYMKEFDKTMDKMMISQEEQVRLDMLLSGLGERCKKILTLHFDGYKMEEIAEIMKFQSATVARKEKYKCNDKLKEHVRDHYPNLKSKLADY